MSYILLQKVKTNQLPQCAGTKFRSCGIWHLQSVNRIVQGGGGIPHIKNEGACQKFEKFCGCSLKFFSLLRGTN